MIHSTTDPHKLFQPKLSQKALERGVIVNLKFGPCAGGAGAAPPSTGSWDACLLSSPRGGYRSAVGWGAARQTASVLRYRQPMVNHSLQIHVSKWIAPAATRSALANLAHKIQTKISTTKAPKTLAPPTLTKLPDSFLESHLPTKVEYEASLKLGDAPLPGRDDGNAQQVRGDKSGPRRHANCVRCVVLVRRRSLHGRVRRRLLQLNERAPEAKSEPWPGTSSRA